MSQLYQMRVELRTTKKVLKYRNLQHNDTLAAAVLTDTQNTHEQQLSAFYSYNKILPKSTITDIRNEITVFITETSL